MYIRSAILRECDLFMYTVYYKIRVCILALSYVSLLLITYKVGKKLFLVTASTKKQKKTLLLLFELCQRGIHCPAHSILPSLHASTKMFLHLLLAMKCLLKCVHNAAINAHVFRLVFTPVLQLEEDISCLED